jgi:hypothetical protein
MATAATWLAKRDELRDSRKSRNDLCFSRAPEPAGIMEDMVRPFRASPAASGRPPLPFVVSHAVADTGADVKAAEVDARGIAQVPLPPS